MRRHALALLIAATPALAEEPPLPDEGWGLMREGAGLLFDGLMAEIGPRLDDMGAALADLEPALRDLAAMAGDFRNYHAPEMLENGDILIRRKTPAEMRLEGLGGPETEL